MGVSHARMILLAGLMILGHLDADDMKAHHDCHWPNHRAPPWRPRRLSRATRMTSAFPLMQGTFVLISGRLGAVFGHTTILLAGGEHGSLFARLLTASARRTRHSPSCGPSPVSAAR
ncbi:hypothetical protein F5Y15DRAFT_347966 [Xylariaceae sp. FL0016]|nr:hypothetical protein F5Y15DRAFT_347966 [Xylariaceae sp. FL0016]